MRMLYPIAGAAARDPVRLCRHGSGEESGAEALAQSRADVRGPVTEGTGRRPWSQPRRRYLAGVSVNQAISGWGQC